MTKWTPLVFDVDDRVVNPDRPKWGQGVVTNAHDAGVMPLAGGGVWVFDRKRAGQRLSVRFADGRTRTIMSAATVLRKLA